MSVAAAVSTSATPVPQPRSRAAMLSFFGLAFGWTWGLWWASSLLKPMAPGLANALFLASGFGPGLAAVAATLAFEGKAGLRRWLRRCLRWRIGWHWYALAAVVPVLIMAGALGIDMALGGPAPAWPDAGRLGMALLQFPLVVIFGGPLGEEFGWRGYALPGLSERMGWRRAGVVVGVAWVAWHIPLLFMAGTVQAGLPIGLFVASTIGLSVVMARLSASTGFSVWPAILLHGVINWCSMVLPIMPAGGDARAYSLVAGLAILVALLVAALPGPRTPAVGGSGLATA